MVWKKVHSSHHIIEQHLVVDNFLSFIIFIFFISFFAFFFVLILLF